MFQQVLPSIEFEALLLLFWPSLQAASDPALHLAAGRPTGRRKRPRTNYGLARDSQDGG